MTDIFREVEEEVRRERFEKLWKKYGDYVIAGAALIIIAAAAFQLWRVYEQRQRARASESYSAAQQMLDAGASSVAGNEFAKLADTAPGGYSQIALLQKGNALYASGNVPEAVDIYKKVAAKGDPLLAPVARIRAAWATADTASRADLDTLLLPLLDQSNPWHPMAREILAYADYKAGDTAKALTEFQSLMKDHDSPGAVRQRSEAMATYLAAGGDKNYGTVPVPKLASPPAPAPANAEPQGAKPQ